MSRSRISDGSSGAGRIISRRFGGSVIESRYRDWLPAVLAGIAFVGFLAAFGWELFAYQHKVVEWARRDLQSRADLAASNLEEPLRTQDFRKIHALGDQCHAEGVRLVVAARSGGRLFDSWRSSETETPSFGASAVSGEYTVSVCIPSSRVSAPFRLAIAGFGLAGLVGMAGVLLFFFVTYRQRVRIRELKRLEKFRREFIADVSHEIRTPLTGILGAVDMMSEEAGGKSEEAGGQSGWIVLLGLIKKESKRLNGLVQRILDLARLEREGEILERSETDLAALARDVASRYGVSFSGPGACAARVDARLIDEALSNLVENARCHSGSTDISVSLAVRDRTVEVSVEDHGIGVPPEQTERIFERFHRVDPARSAETGGAGLGLAIVRRIARLHGGDVTFAAAKPRGSVFIVRLPAP